MGYAPAALNELVERFRRERRTLSSAADGVERLGAEYIEPPLELLGWDVPNRYGQEPVERRQIAVPDSTRPLALYLLHEQAFRYRRHYLVGVSVPPVGRSAPTLLAALDQHLSHSEVLIETLALTDFACLRFYDNTPTPPHQVPKKRALLYTLPCSQYGAWWDAVPFPARLLFNRRKFELYAAKLRQWGGLPTASLDDEASGQASGSSSSMP